MLHRPEGSDFLYSFSVCFFNFLFFYFTNNRSKQNHPQMLQPWSKSMRSSAPWGRNCVEGRCNNSDVLETHLEVLNNIRVRCKYPHSFCPPLSPRADTSTSSTYCPVEKGEQGRNARRKKKSILDLGVSDLKLSARFRAKTFCISKAQQKALVPKGWAQKGREENQGWE